MFNELKAPEIKFNKSGYEIRTNILQMAKELLVTEFQSKFQGWELSVEKDKQTGAVITKVGMPEFPGLEQILGTAEKMYEFVNKNAVNKPK
jgi:hypothetical protein